MTTFMVVTIFKGFICIDGVVIVDALHEVSSSHFLNEELGEINNDLYITLSKSVHQDKQAVPQDSCKDANLRMRTHDDQDDFENHEGEKSYNKQMFVGQSTSRNDEIMLESSEHVEQPSSAGKTPKLKQSGRVQERWIELFGNQFMSKAEYDYNIDQMKIAMLDDMDWAREQVLGVKYKEPLPLVGPQCIKESLKHFFNEDLEYLKSGNKDLNGRTYDLFVTKRHAAEYKVGWIEEDIDRLF
ncbi:hypothetical protein Tco_0347313 [Tanacetum coccineum]